MKKKLLLVLSMVALFVCVFAISVSAQDAYVERVPSHLIDSSEALEYFIVLDGEEYYGAIGSTLNSINSTTVETALNTLVERGEYTDAVTALGTKYMIKFVLPATVNGTQIAHIYMNDDAFKKNSYFANYCAAIVYAPTHTSTGDANQYCGNIRSIDFGVNSQITQIPYCYMKNAFNLRELKNFPQYLTSIEQSAFAYCTKLDGVLYINAVTVRGKAFDCGIVNVDGIILGRDTVNLETEAFGTTNGSKNVKFIEFQGDVTKMNIVSSANNQGAFYFSGGSQRQPYSGLTCLILSHPDNQALITEGTTTFQDILPNVYFNADSMNGGNLVKKGHNNQYTISYESFLEKGTKYGTCTDCNYVSDEVEAPALFTCQGYSAPENGSGGIAIGYTVNNEAIKAYTEATGKTLKYGIFAVLKDRLGINDVFAADGTAAEGVISAEITNYSFVAFALKIIGFETDTQKRAKLAMGAYVAVSDGETTKYSYMQYGTPEGNEKYCFVSYDDIVSTNSNEDEAVTQ